MKSTKVQTLAEFGGNIGIFGLKTLHAYVLGEHTSMKNELWACSRPMLKVRGLSIKPRSSTICIDLSMHVHVVKD